MGKKKEDEKPDHRSIPESPGLGWGMAEKARQLFLGRRRKIEEELEKATGKKPKK
jgi:hypothetical protein